MAFRISIDNDRKESLLKTIEEGLQRAKSDRFGFDRRRISIFNAYRNRPKKKVVPFEGCSNFSTPIITRAVERMTVQTQQTIAPRGYFGSLVATPNQLHGAVDEVNERAEAVSAFLSHVFRNKMNLAEKWEPFVRGGLLYGNAVAKLWHNRVVRKTRKVERQPAIALVPNVPEAASVDEEVTWEEIVVPGEQVVSMMFGNRPNVEIKGSKARSGAPDGTSAWDVKFYDQDERRRREIHIEIYFDEEAGENVVLTESDEIVSDHPDFMNIDLDDIYFTLDSDTIAGAQTIFIRQTMTFSEIVFRWRSGVFNQISKEDIADLRSRVGKDESTGEIPEDALYNKLSTLHTHPSPSVQDRADFIEGAVEGPYQNLDVWEVFMRYDLDLDDEDEEIVVWVDFASRKILRVAHLYEDYHSNKRPLVEWGLVPNGNRTLKIGVGELLMPLQVQFDQLFNNRADAASVTLMPGGFYRPGAGFYPSKMRWAPGAWIPVDNPQTDIMFYTPTNNPRDTINVEQFLLALTEDLSISTYAFGRGPDRPNAPRTARGTLAILQQDAIKMDYILKRLMPAIEDICHKTLYLLRLHASRVEQFRVLGTDKILTISPEDLDSRYTFTLDVDAVSANKEIQRIYAAQALQMVGPIAAAPPEQVPPGIRKLARNLLNRLEFRDANLIIADPPRYKRAPQSQDDENIALFGGISIEPVLEDDHEDHLMKMDLIENTPEFNAMPLDWVLSVWKPHKRIHFQMLQSLRAQQEQMMKAAAGGGTMGGGPMEGMPRMGFLPTQPGGGIDVAPEATGTTMSGTAPEAQAV